MRPRGTTMSFRECWSTNWNTLDAVTGWSIYALVQSALSTGFTHLPGSPGEGSVLRQNEPAMTQWCSGPSELIMQTSWSVLPGDYLRHSRHRHCRWQIEAICRSA